MLNRDLLREAELDPVDPSENPELDPVDPVDPEDAFEGCRGSLEANFRTDFHSSCHSDSSKRRNFLEQLVLANFWF